MGRIKQYSYNTTIDTAIIMILIAMYYKSFFAEYPLTLPDLVNLMQGLPYYPDGKNERLSTPIQFLKNNFKDCDDKAIFVLSWLYWATEDYHNGLFLLSKTTNTPFFHVYNAYYEKDWNEWLEFDFTYREFIGIHNHMGYKKIMHPTKEYFDLINSLQISNVIENEDYIFDIILKEYTFLKSLDRNELFRKYFNFLDFSGNRMHILNNSFITFNI